MPITGIPGTRGISSRNPTTSRNPTISRSFWTNYSNNHCSVELFFGVVQDPMDFWNSPRPPLRIPFRIPLEIQQAEFPRLGFTDSSSFTVYFLLAAICVKILILRFVFDFWVCKYLHVTKLCEFCNANANVQGYATSDRAARWLAAKVQDKWLNWSLNDYGSLCLRLSLT